MRINTRDAAAKKWLEPANDGRIAFRANDGHDYEIVEQPNGAFILKSMTGHLDIRPLGRNQIGFKVREK